MNANQSRIFNSIVEMMARGELSAGDKLPTEVELGKRFETSRMNAHLAVKELERAGLVRRNKRQGTIVEKKAVSLDLDLLRRKSSNTVHVFASAPEKRYNIHWNESTLYEFEALLKRDNIDVCLEELPEEAREFRSLVEKISTQHSRYIVLVPDRCGSSVICDNIDCLKNLSADVVLFDRGDCELPGTPFHTVGYCPFSQGELAGRHVYDHHSHDVSEVWFVGGGNRYWATKRLEGARCVLGNRLVDFSDLEHSEVAKRLKSFKRGGICLMAATDGVAGMIIDICAREGMIAPRDFSLVSFDNKIECRKYNLTTIANPLDKIAPTLADIVTERIPVSKDYMCAKIILKPVLIRRSTS